MAASNTSLKAELIFADSQKTTKHVHKTFLKQLGQQTTNGDTSKIITRIAPQPAATDLRNWDSVACEEAGRDMTNEQNRVKKLKQHAINNRMTK
jgi:hypothetical protein